MGWLSPPAAADTNAERKAQYEERARRTLWIGAGLLGVIALVAGDLSAQVITNAPAILVALIPTLLVLAGGALGYARSGFEWAAHQLPDDDANANSKPAEDWPAFAELMYLSALSLVATAAVIYLVAFWWASIRA